MFGEIDCREGLTMAVDKLKYETVDAAMDVLLNIYKGSRLCRDSLAVLCICLSVTVRAELTCCAERGTMEAV